MATARSTAAPTSTANSNQAAKNKDDLPTLKAKVTELERQCTDYKTKLDELRRAKATTVVKLEKEYVNTSIPGLNRPEKAKPCEKCDEYERILETEKRSNAQLKRLLEQKENTKPTTTTSATNSASCNKCNEFKNLYEKERLTSSQLTEELKLQKKMTEEERYAKEVLDRTLEVTQNDLTEVKNLVEALRVENEDYKNIFETMKREHAEKMADLCRREEEAKKQVATWEQMYREWMATMERRVNNLQVTNEELQTWLHEENEQDDNLPTNRNPNQRR